MATILKKITSRDLGIDLEAAKEQETRLYLIYGKARSVTSGSGTYGDYERLDGQFEAVNIATGEIFISGSCFLPGAVHNLIVGQLGGEGVEVQFSFEVGAKPADNAVGYEYTVKEIVDASGVDNLSELRAASRVALN